MKLIKKMFLPIIAMLIIALNAQKISEPIETLETLNCSKKKDPKKCLENFMNIIRTKFYNTQPLDSLITARNTIYNSYLPGPGQAFGDESVTQLLEMPGAGSYLRKNSDTTSIFAGYKLKGNPIQNEDLFDQPSNAHTERRVVAKLLRNEEDLKGQLLVWTRGSPDLKSEKGDFINCVTYYHRLAEKYPELSISVAFSELNFVVDLQDNTEAFDTVLKYAVKNIKNKLNCVSYQFNKDNKYVYQSNNKVLEISSLNIIPDEDMYRSMKRMFLTCIDNYFNGDQRRTEDIFNDLFSKNERIIFSQIHNANDRRRKRMK